MVFNESVTKLTMMNMIIVIIFNFNLNSRTN